VSDTLDGSGVDEDAGGGGIEDAGDDEGDGGVGVVAVVSKKGRGKERRGWSASFHRRRQQGSIGGDRRKGGI
jgi:hypothetical protein